MKNYQVVKVSKYTEKKVMNKEIKKAQKILQLRLIQQ